MVDAVHFVDWHCYTRQLFKDACFLTQMIFKEVGKYYFLISIIQQQANNDIDIHSSRNHYMLLRCICGITY